MKPEARDTTTPEGGGEPKRCIICGKPRQTRYDPFCSKRCADIDLHRWLKGAYVVPGEDPPEPDGEDNSDQ